MARSVLFHNRVIIHPGAEAYVDLAGMAQPGVDTTRIAAVVGEAPYGEPGVIHVFADSEAARQYFGPSDLADAIKLLFEPSNDERVDGGAVLVYAYNARRVTQSERWLVRELLTPKLVTITFADFRDDTTDPITPAYFEFAGTETEGHWNNLVVEIVSGAGKKQQRQIDTSVERIPGTQRCNLRSDDDWDIKPYSTLAGQTATARIVAPMAKLPAEEWGARGNDNEVEFGRQPLQRSYEMQTRLSGRVVVNKDPFGGLRKPTFQIKMDPTGGGVYSVWSDPANWAISQAVDTLPVEGTTAGAATATILDGNTNALTLNSQQNRWAIITAVPGGAPAGIQALLGKIYKIKSNTAAGAGLAQVVLNEPGLGIAPVVGIEWKVFAASDVYLEVDGEDGAAKTLKIKIADGGSAIDLVNLDLSLHPTLKDLEDRLDGIAGLEATIGDGVDSSLTTDRFDFGAHSDHYGPYISSVLAGVEAAGSTSIVLEESDNFPTSGFNYRILVEPGTSKEEELIVTSNTVGTETLGLLIPTTLEHAAGSVVEMRQGSNLLRGPAEEDDAGQVVMDNLVKTIEFVASSVGAFTAERATGPASSTFKDEIGAAQPEDDRDVWKRFHGGGPGTSRVTIPTNVTEPGYPVSYQDGFDKLLRNRDIRVEVPCASSDQSNWTSGDILTMVNLFQEHLITAEENKGERIGIIGLDFPLEAGTYGGTTFNKGLLDVIRLLNDSRISVVGQNTRVQSSRGREEVLPSWAYACQEAGKFLGVDRGEPITFKYTKTAELIVPYNDWNPLDPVDLKKALLGGLLYGEPFEGRWRTVRGFTTHVSTDNLGYTDMSVWDIRNYEQRRLRDNLELRFTGRGIGVVREGVRFVAPANVASIRSLVATLLEEDRAEGYILDSQDESGEWLHAWRALAVKISGDVGRVKVQVFPKTGLNFILIDFTFQIPTLSA